MTESRSALQAEHASLVRRLHQRSDDFDASSRLKVVITALQRLPYPEAIVGPVRRKRRT